jgi:hypothetical protein
LDTKFWILLREARTGRSADPDTRRLLSLLLNLVAERRAVCPLSAEILDEILLQNDPATFQMSINLIDDLSRGICLVERLDRIGIETMHFFRETIQGTNQVYPLSQLVWTKAPFVLGIATPTLNDPELTANGTELNVQKAFLDYEWGLGLADIFAHSSGPFQRISRPAIAAEVNKMRSRSSGQYTSFDELALIELGGALEGYRPQFAKAMRAMYENDKGIDQPLHSDVMDKEGQLVANFFYQAFRLKRLSRQLPTVQIEAYLHAAVRWDAKRMFDENDFADFRHASAALPYFDYFLTDGGLSHLLSQGNLPIKERFPCIVIANAKNAIVALENI